MSNLNYGKYDVPQTLLKILDLQAALVQKEMLPYGDLLGYYFSLDDIRYLNTPLDLLSFASPGGDGIHYGFLTDFGLAKDLEEAYIVRVSPMDFDDPVKIVARNLRDFMRMMCYAPASLDLLDIYSNEDYCKEVAHEDIAIVEADPSLKVRTIFKDYFELKPIKDTFSYYQSVQNERTKDMIIQTNDGIGIANKVSLSLEHPSYELSRYSRLTMDIVETFFKTATQEAKLAFIRDAQSYGLIYDNEEAKEYLRNELIMLNLPDEAERIMYEV